MTFGRRPAASRGIQQNRMPAWLVSLIGIALVFGLYYLWIGLRDFMATGGLGILEATEQAAEVSTATAERIQIQQAPITPLPSFTPVPECQDFVVVSEIRANLRGSPSMNGPLVGSVLPGDTVCVLERDSNPDWYVLDLSPEVRRIERAYISADLVEAVNPTPTPSNTFTPLPTVTPVPTDTATITPSPAPTDTPDPEATNTPTPTPLPSPTTAIQNI
jgi:hypothetical protein